MTWIKSLSSVFFAAAVLVFAIWLLMETCSKKKPALTEKMKGSIEFLKEQQRLRDSAFHATEKKDRAHKADSAKWKRINDSTTTKLSITKRKLEASQASNDMLAAGVKDSYNQRDTSRFISTCLKLGDSVITLNARVDQYKVQVDTLMKAKDSLQAVTQKRLEERDQLLSDMRRSANKSDSTIGSLQNDIRKAAKKADKKYTVVIGGGAGIPIQGRPGGAVGIFIGRTIIRF